MRNRFLTAVVSVILGSGIFAGVAATGGQLPSEPTVEHGRVRISTGPTLHYAAQGHLDGHVVILVHGYSDSWYSFSQLMPLLPESWRVYAPTLRGHGDSDRPVGDYSPPTLARDVLAFMDAIGAERATLVGHSLGGLVVQHAAALAPERVDRLVILGSVTTAQAMPGMNEFRAEIHSLHDPVPVEFARAFQESTLFVRPRAAFVDSVVGESAKLPAHVWQAVIDGLLETGPAAGLETLNLPTLVVWGDRDAYMPFTEQLALVDLLRARLVVYPRIGHGLHWEDPAMVASDLIDFIR